MWQEETQTVGGVAGGGDDFNRCPAAQIDPFSVIQNSFNRQGAVVKIPGDKVAIRFICLDKRTVELRVTGILKLPLFRRNESGVFC